MMIAFLFSDDCTKKYRRTGKGKNLKQLNDSKIANRGDKAKVNI
jgi:hypothetical protein